MVPSEWYINVIKLIGNSRKHLIHEWWRMGVLDMDWRRIKEWATYPHFPVISPSINMVGSGGWWFTLAYSHTTNLTTQHHQPLYSITNIMFQLNSNKIIKKNWRVEIPKLGAGGRKEGMSHLLHIRLQREKKSTIGNSCKMTQFPSL